MYFQPQNPILVIARQKMNGFGEHWGVQLPDGRVAHYTAEKNLQVTSSEEFAQGRDVRTIREIPPHLNGEVLRRLEHVHLNPRPYHATQWNCEIFANWLTGDQPVSQQVNGWGVLGLIAAAICIGTRMQ